MGIERKTSGSLEKNTIWTRFPVVFATALFCCILWGSASPAIKIAYQLFRIPADDTASRIVLAGARFMIAGVMTIVFGSLLSRRMLIPKAESWGKIGILALVQTVGQYYFFFMALANTSGVRGSIINASGNFIAILFAVYLFRFEKMTPRKLIGCIVGFAGIILIMGGPGALTDGGAITLSVGATVFFVSLSKSWNIVSGQIWPKSNAANLLAHYMNADNAEELWNLLYLGFISAGAYTLWGVLLKYNPVSRVSILGFMNPVMGVLLSALFLEGEGSEAFSLTGLFALLLVCAGIVIVNTASRRSRHPDGFSQEP